MSERSPRTDEGTFAVSLEVSRSSNGYEYQLLIGGERVGKPAFLTGNPTPGQKRHALMIALGLHQGGDRG